MKNWRSSSLLRSPVWRRGVVVATLTAFLWLLALSASAALHHEEHHDADAAHHECAVTLLAHGKLDAAPPPTLAPLPPVGSLSSPAVALSIQGTVDLRLMPGRAPPASR